MDSEKYKDVVIKLYLQIIHAEISYRVQLNISKVFENDEFEELKNEYHEFFISMMGNFQTGVNLSITKLFEKATRGNVSYTLPYLFVFAKEENQLHKNVINRINKNLKEANKTFPSMKKYRDKFIAHHDIDHVDGEYQNEIVMKDLKKMINLAVKILGDLANPVSKPRFTLKEINKFKIPDLVSLLQNSFQ